MNSSRSGIRPWTWAGVIIIGGLTGAALFSRLESRKPSVVVEDTDDLVREISLNVSQYIFWDVNADGIYDIGDRVLSGVPVQLWRPDGSFVERTSNTGGFTNFTNSIGVDAADVSVPGDYTFDVRAPKGWSITTGNAVQEVKYEAAPGTRPGIIADVVPHPVGLTPVLAVEGRRTGDETLTLVADDGSATDIVPDGDGVYSTPITNGGLWRIQWRADPASGTRSFEVRDLPVWISTWRAPPDRARDAQVTTVDFQDITNGTIQKVPTSYRGLIWENAVVVDRESYGGEGYVNVAMGRKYVAYGSSGYPVSISRDEPFDLVGATIALAWLIGEDESVEVTAWRGGDVVHQETLSVSAINPIWFDANYRGINRVTFQTEKNWQIVIGELEVILE